MEVRAGYKQTEVGVIPKDWDVTTVGAEFSIQLGKMLDSEKNIGVTKPFLGNRAVQWGRIDLTDIGEIKLTPSDLQRFRLRMGDLLVCEGGEVGRAAIWQEPMDECYYQKALHRLRPKRGFNIVLMLNLLQHLSVSGFLLNFVTQTSIAHLPKEKFETVPIPLPPTKAEQEAIAAVLSDADALIEVLEQLIDKKRQVKQGAMQELLTGKRRLPGFSGEWEVKRLGEVADTLKGNGLSKDQISSTGTRPCILYGELFTTYKRVISTVVSRTDSCDGCSSISGDVLMPGSTTTSGIDLATASALLEDGVALGGDINIIRRRGNDYDPAFLANYLTCGRRKQIAEITQGITIHHLYGRDLKTLMLKLPLLDEQTAIAAILFDMDAEIAVLEAKLAKARQVKQGMMQELLTGRIRLVS